MQATDVALTTYALMTGLASELNPLALFLYNGGGGFGLAITKSIGSGIIVALMYGLVTWHERFAKPMMAVTTTIMAAVVVNNYVVLS